jgi:hypothetical protein
VHLYTCVDQNNADCVVVGKPGYLVGTVLEYAEDISPKTAKPFLKIASIAKLGDGEFDTDFLFDDCSEEDYTDREDEDIFAEPLLVAAPPVEEKKEEPAPKRKRRSKAEMQQSSETTLLATDLLAQAYKSNAEDLAQDSEAHREQVAQSSPSVAAFTIPLSANTVFDIYNKAKQECEDDWLYVFQAAVGRLG